MRSCDCIVKIAAYYVLHWCMQCITKYKPNVLRMYIIGSKASPTTAPKPRRHKSSTSSDMFDDKESSGLFSSGQPQEGTAGSPARKKVCLPHRRFARKKVCLPHKRFTT